MGVRQLKTSLSGGGKVRVQPCVSPVWDTAIATIALADAQRPTTIPDCSARVRWLLEKEVRVPETGSETPRHRAERMHFQFSNERIPTSTTRLWSCCLQTQLADRQSGVREATRRGVNWLSRCRTETGLGAFDVDINNHILTKVPFADHNAMLARAAPTHRTHHQTLGTLGLRADNPAISRALDYLGARRSRKGAGTGGGDQLHLRDMAGLAGLRAIDFRWTPGDPKAADWLNRSSRPTAAGVSRAGATTTRTDGRGEVTVSQTAWGILVSSPRPAGGDAAAVASIPAPESEARRDLGGSRPSPGRVPSRLLLKISYVQDLFPLMAWRVRGDRGAHHGRGARGPGMPGPRPPKPFDI